MDNNTIENSVDVLADERMSLDSTVDELLESSAPYQRALLGVLAVADHYQLDVAPLLMGLAYELPFAIGGLTFQLAEQVVSGVDAIDALVELPELLSPESVLALRLARDEGTLSALYVAVSERYQGSEVDGYTINTKKTSKVMRLIGRVFVIGVLMNYIMSVILPELVMLLNDFEVELPAPMSLLLVTMEYLSRLWFLGVLIVLALLVYGLWTYRKKRRSWNPLAWRQRAVSSSVNRRRMLALAAQTGHSLSSGLAMISGIPPLARLFKRMEGANARINKGQGEWESLAAEKMISKREAAALECSTTGETQAWLLRWSASNRRNFEMTRTAIAFRIATGIVHVLLAMLVALVCIAMFSFLVTLMKSLSQPL